MNIQRSMFNKKNQKTFDICVDMIEYYSKARGKSPTKINLKNKEYTELLSQAELWCVINRKDEPKELKIDGVLLEKL